MREREGSETPPRRDLNSAMPATEDTPGTFRDFFLGQAPHCSPKPFLRTISSFQLARVGRARWSREMPGVQNSGGG